MKILFLYHNEQAKELAKQLESKGHILILWKERLSVENLETLCPERVLSYTYRYIISNEVIGFCKYPIINLHISYLPWNRGADPNFWNFMENTPKGVTIHQIDGGIDTGKIILQKELFFDEEKETFASSYQKLNEEIMSLFLGNVENILANAIRGVETSSKGSYHNKKELMEFRKKHPFSWEEGIADLKRSVL